MDEQVCPIFHNRYRVIAPIGSGNMGKVFLVEDLKLCGKKWAMKQLDGSLREQQLSELEMLTRMDHPHLPRVVDFFFSTQQPYAYIVMDFIHGQTLHTLHQDRHQSWSILEVLDYARQICDLYQYLHEQHQPAIIHRDLKPENVMIDRHGQVKVIDFGIARQFKTNAYKDTLPFATVGFAAPEQLEGRLSDARTDLYALGCLIFYLLSGGKLLPLQKVKLVHALPHVPDRVRTLISQLTADQPNARIQSASLVKVEIDSMIAQLEEVKIQQYAHPLGRDQRPVIVACRSIESASGCSQISMMAAHYLARQGFNVALIENNDSPCFQEWSEILGMKKRNRKFNHLGVDYYVNGNQHTFLNSLNANYDFIVLDFGSSLQEEEQNEFDRADVPMVVCCGSPIRLQRANQWLSERTEISRWRIVIFENLTEERLIVPFHHKHIWHMSFANDPRNVSLQTAEIFRKLFYSWIPIQENNSFIFKYSFLNMYSFMRRMKQKLWQSLDF